jgi:hypothetical protein
MKFKQYLNIIADSQGFIPLFRFRWEIRRNPRKTAREEAIAAKVMEMANPRENITGHFPWGPEEQMVLQQLWIQPEKELVVWRDVHVKGSGGLYSVVETAFGDLPVPNSVKEPGTVQGDFRERLREILGE